jgi:hypothetical protein
MKVKNALKILYGTEGMEEKYRAVDDLLTYSSASADTRVEDILNDILDDLMNEWAQRNNLASSTRKTYRSRVKTGLKSALRQYRREKQRNEDRPEPSYVTIGVTLDSGYEAKVQVPEDLMNFDDARRLSKQLFRNAKDFDPSDEQQKTILDPLSSPVSSA